MGMETVYRCDGCGVVKGEQQSGWFKLFALANNSASVPGTLVMRWEQRPSEWLTWTGGNELDDDTPDYIVCGPRCLQSKMSSLLEFNLQGQGKPK